MNLDRTNLLSLLSSPVSLKILAIGVLTVLLLKPSTMIESLIQEREKRQKEVVTEISSKWGKEQTITGPVISISNTQDAGGLPHMHFLPDTLHIKARVHPHERHRGIFKAVLYNAELELTGSFSYPQTGETKIIRNEGEWSGASIAIGISDVRGIREQVVAQVNDKQIAMNPGLYTTNLMSSGASGIIELDRNTKGYRFKFVMQVNGSERINFVPLGKLTTVSLSSEWPDPSFRGAYIPDKSDIREKGFDATWKILDLNRDYPQYWQGTTYKQHVQNSAFGVGLITPVDFYQKSMRTTKYAVLFVALTFVAFFISELVAKVRLHPMQYLLIGSAIVNFYILLISLSEHVGFGIAYGISSVAVVVLVTLYASSILRSKKLALIVGGALSIVYGYLYWLVQMVDYTFVVGSTGLFIIIAAIMILTRNIDWYGIKLQSDPDPEPEFRDE